MLAYLAVGVGGLPAAVLRPRAQGGRAAHVEIKSPELAGLLHLDRNNLEPIPKTVQARRSHWAIGFSVSPRAIGNLAQESLQLLAFKL